MVGLHERLADICDLASTAVASSLNRHALQETLGVIAAIARPARGRKEGMRGHACGKECERRWEASPLGDELTAPGWFVEEIPGAGD